MGIDPDEGRRASKSIVSQVQSANANCKTYVRNATSLRLPKFVRIVEVGPRDGLQNESGRIPTAVKVKLVHDLASVGLQTIEITGFVSPRRVPQLSDADDVTRAVERVPGVHYPVLVPNYRGFERAYEAGANEIAICASASEGFCEKNLGCSISESLGRFQSTVVAARARNMRVRAYVSCIAGCPYDGEVSPTKVASVAATLYEMGCFEVSLGDTIGCGTPESIMAAVQAVVKSGVPVDALAIHCHDTKGTALPNVLAAMSCGVAVVDSSVGGLGGCPFAPGAPGNLATEALVEMLHELAVDCGNIDLQRLRAVGEDICKTLGREPPTYRKIRL